MTLQPKTRNFSPKNLSDNDISLTQTTEIVNMRDEEFELEVSNVDNTTVEEQRSSPEEGQFIIKNIDTGEFCDLRQEVNVNNCLILTGVSWTTFCKKVRRSNEALWDAAEDGDHTNAKKLLDKTKQVYPADINSKALDGWTALHMASNAGHYSIVDLLIKHEANIESKTSMARTPLHLSCMRGHEKIVQLLVDNGASINALDKDFCTPLHYASEHGYVEVLNYLLSKNPDVGAKNHAGLTCIDVANSVEVRKIFEDKGLVNENTVNSFGRTYMDDALFYTSRLDTVGKLLMVGNMNQKMAQRKILYQRELENQRNSEPERRISNVRIQDWSGNEEAKLQDNGQENIDSRSFKRHLRLGGGSFGEVFLVEKVDTKELYAMKVLRKIQIKKQNLTRYAKTERNVLSIMNHPFIVKLNYAFQTEHKLYLFMDYCPGGDLAGLLRTKQRFSEELARIYAAEVTLALGALHDKDIIFRDLKPDNIVLDAQGHAMLTDFGLSKEGVKQELQRTFCGSIAYLAPEMIKRTGHNKTVDWYLLGVLIYEMLLGVPPYYSPNRNEMHQNIVQGKLLLTRSLSSEARDIIMKLLKRNPNQRLGASAGVEEIKSHPWFRGINWQDVMDRKLKPPLPRRREVELDGDVHYRFEGGSENDRNYMEGWSFIQQKNL